MRRPTGTLVTVCALVAALLVTGFGRDGDRSAAEPPGELLLQPAAARGPDPFTRSAVIPTATAPATVSAVTRTPQRDATTPRSVSGGTPGLYGGTAGAGSCDVERQLADLTADRRKVNAFAQVASVSPASVPRHLRGLAPVVLRADTRVTDHGYRAGRASGFQAVLQPGTAVLVDTRGVPRVRCAGGNPLTPPRAPRDGGSVDGRPWPGYRPERVIVIAPAERPVTDITILDSVHGAWIERRIDHDCRYDHVVPLPLPEPSPPVAVPGEHPSDSASPGLSVGADPPGPARECHEDACLPISSVPWATPMPTPTTHPRTPAAPPPGTTTPEDPGTGIGPEAVPDTPDLPDGGGLIPDDPDDPDSPATRTGAVLDSPTHHFGV
ncbi:DUF6777 domain-containing protein [Streptomyces sp. NPDC057253]|uniref:DUF6777 domain-containing protein n=1 Tax=Streptomyces sp. NPDC057253 TaxID=3346069 RepID=UPI0036349823